MIAIVRLIILQIAIILVFEKCTVSGDVKSPPYFIQQPSSTKEILFYVEDEDDPIGRSFQIPCSANGDPQPNYYWTKDGQIFNWTSQADRISQQINSGTLTIRAPKPSDVGQYQCFAENNWGIATSNSVFARNIVLGSFKDEAPRVIQVKEGQPFNLTCEAPYGYPKPNINWLIQDSNGKLIGIDDPRITVDPVGTLWFSNITEQDAIEDALYACAVTSTYISEGKFGSKVILEIESSSLSVEENEIAPIRQYLSNAEEIATSGKKVRLYCIFGGTPLPIVTWYKNGKVIHFRSGISLKDSSKSIEIKKATPSDEGNYTCQAKNGIGESISHTITLKVLVEPRFVKKPESVTIDEEETVEFHCQATGNPTPEIIWIHNGKLLSEAPFNPRRAISANSIIIERLWKNDTGNYGCNATNSVGYVYQDAYVNVLAEPPNIVEFPQEQEIIDGDTVSMRCRAVGSPKPRIKWARNDSELINDRFTTTKNGDLSINNATLSDQGEYTCIAQNKISQANTTVNLFVRQRTRIPAGLAPSDIEVPAGDKAIFKCSALIDPLLDLTITWLQNGHPIDFTSDERFIRGNDNSLLITHTKQLDTGTYTCIASTRLDNATSEATLIVQDIPNPPAIVSLSCDSKDIKISWMNMGDNSAPVQRYVIEYSTSSAPDVWTTLSDSIPVTDTTLATQVRPWNNYTFRIMAVNKIGSSLPSESSSICSVPPEIPYKNPDNVTVEAKSEQNFITLDLSWKLMPPSEHNGPGFYYQVYWKLETPESEWQSKIIEDWQIQNYTIFDVAPYQKYIVKVTAGNDLGEVEETSETLLSCITLPSMPDKNPNDVTVRDIEPTTLEVSWKLMEKIDQNGPGFYYKVLWKNNNSEDEWQSRNITDWQTGSYKIHNLLPYQTYLVTVIAGNDIGQKALDSNSPIKHTTLPDTPYKNPDNVTVRATEPTILLVSWKPMPETDHNGPGFYYNVFWKMDTPEENWKSFTIRNWETSEYKLNTSPYQKYLVKVAAGNEKGQSIQPPVTRVGYYEEDVPLEAPTNLTLVQIISTTRAKIAWNRVPEPTIRGNFRGYRIHTWPEYGQHKGTVIELIIEQNQTSIIINNLIPNTKNKVRIAVFNGKYIGPFSDELEINTPEGVPEQVQSLQAKPFGSSALSLIWKPPLKTNGHLTGYKIQYQTTSEDELGIMIDLTPQITNPNQTESKLSGLKSDTNYKIYIRATTNAGEGKVYSIEQKTKEIPSTPLIKPDFQLVPIDSENYTTVKIIWLPCGSNVNVNECQDQSIGSEFQVEYRLKGEANYEKITERNQDNVIIHDLQPNKEYEFIVSSIDGALISEPNEKSFKTTNPMSENFATDPEKRIASDQLLEKNTNYYRSHEEFIFKNKPDAIQESSNTSTLMATEEPYYESPVSSIGWIFVIISIIFLIIIIILIVIYLMKLNEGDKYFVHEKEIKHGRPDDFEDPDFHEVSQPLNGNAPASPVSPSTRDNDGMVMIPLN